MERGSSSRTGWRDFTKTFLPHTLPPYISRRNNEILQDVDTMLLKRIRIPGDANIAIIPSNHSDPAKCMWMINNRELDQKNVYIIFPYPMLWRSCCHAIVGTSKEHSCFAHLSPITSYMRQSTAEVAQILKNLERQFPDSDSFHFTAYYFQDDGNEEKFRKILQKVLKFVTFVPVYPKNSIPRDSKACLVFFKGRIYFATQSFLKTEHVDVSDMGIFNRDLPIPVYA